MKPVLIIVFCDIRSASILYSNCNIGDIFLSYHTFYMLEAILCISLLPSGRVVSAAFFASCCTGTIRFDADPGFQLLLSILASA